MIEQISVFLENSAGTLADTTVLLAENGVDIRALNIAETSDYGILRIVVEDSNKAMEVLKNGGLVASSTPVVCAAVNDQPGALARVLKILSSQGMDVEYMYSIVSQWAGSAYMVIRVKEPEAAEALLRENGVHIAEKSELEIR